MDGKLKGDLENLMGTVIGTAPIALYNIDKKKLEMTEEDLKPEKLFMKFEEKYLKNFKFPERTDEFRPKYANTYYGGIDFPDKKTTDLLRGMGWDLIKQIGQKILSGNFNLTTVTIPIKVMVPISILQHVTYGHFNFPLYLGLACKTNDYIEKMKLVITATISCWYRSNVILKPLNPILGETYEMVWEDGSHEYVEQTSHHPPCSNFIIYGPNNNYKYSGYLNFTSNAWFNSFKLTNSGKRQIDFKDGTHIDFNYPYDQYSNTFWGCIRIECIGEMTFKDTTHNISAKVTLGGNSKNALSDFFDGEIVDGDGKVLSKIEGSYLSHIDFDGKRYWDIRDNIDIEEYPIKNQIPSSSIYRPDSLLLLEKKLDEAQEQKISLEELQRKDRRLRAAWVEDHPEDK